MGLDCSRSNLCRSWWWCDICASSARSWALWALWAFESLWAYGRTDFCDLNRPSNYLTNSSLPRAWRIYFKTDHACTSVFACTFVSTYNFVFARNSIFVCVCLGSLFPPWFPLQVIRCLPTFHILGLLIRSHPEVACSFASRDCLSVCVLKGLQDFFTNAVEW